MTLTACLVLPIAAYLIGAIPFGLLLGKAKGVDLRQHGSRNIGASNAGRVLGRRYFVMVLILDALKGFGPVFVAGRILGALAGMHEQGPAFFAAWLAVALAAILGHVFPVWLRFRGGKGVATSLGVLMGLYPYYTLPGFAAVGLWLLVTATTRYISVGSITAAGAFPLLYLAAAWWRHWSLDRQWPLLVFAVAMAGLIVLRHRGNIARLRAGTENRIGRPAVLDELAPQASADGAGSSR